MTAAAAAPAAATPARLDLWRLIEGLRASGTTSLLTTHQLAEAERLCICVALMQAGRVAALGSVQAVTLENAYLEWVGEPAAVGSAVNGSTTLNS